MFARLASPASRPTGSAACRNVHNSTATLTALIERIGYDAAEQLAEHVAAAGGDPLQTIRRLVVEHGLLTAGGIRRVDLARARHAAGLEPRAAAPRPGRLVRLPAILARRPLLACGFASDADRQKLPGSRAEPRRSLREKVGVRGVANFVLTVGASAAGLYIPSGQI